MANQPEDKGICYGLITFPINQGCRQSLVVSDSTLLVILCNTLVLSIVLFQNFTQILGSVSLRKKNFAFKVKHRTRICFCKQKMCLFSYRVSAGKRDQNDFFLKKKFLSKIDVDLII